MKKQGEFYVVDIRCTKENASEVVRWLETNGQKLERVESTLSDAQMSLSELAEKTDNYDSANNGFLMEVNFRNHEVALLAEMKFS